MRRNDREITDQNRIRQIIAQCDCCRLGFCDSGEVYIVPLSFGFAEVSGETVLYFHSASEGRKIDLIRQGHPVGFEMDTGYKFREGATACACSAAFQSVVGTGEIAFVSDPGEKKSALQAIMYHNTKKTDWLFSEEKVASVCVFKVTVRRLSCKVHD